MSDLALLDDKGQGNHPAKIRRRPYGPVKLMLYPSNASLCNQDAKQFRNQALENDRKLSPCDENT
jgi:hypothetical protein